jgi:phosphoserine phosphatase RsbU/P
MCAFFSSGKSLPSRRDTVPVPELQQAQLASVSYGQRIGGDLHDYIRVSPTRVVFALMDVAGRFDQNGPIVSAAQNVFRSSGPQLLAKEDANEADAMIEICIQLNRSILKAAGRVCSCPTFAGCYNESLGTVCYVNAGHIPGLVRDQASVSELGATGFPLGLFSHSTPDASIVAIEPGGALLLVSRGMVEARHKTREFGLPQVKDILLQTPMKTGPETCAVVLSKVQEFLASKPARNDITAIALARSAAGKTLAAAG